MSFFFRGEFCGVKEMIIIISACKCCIHAAYLLAFSRCIGVAPYLPRLSNSNFQNEWFFFFLPVGAQAHVIFFLPNFDVIRTKEAEIKPV